MTFLQIPTKKRVYTKLVYLRTNKVEFYLAINYIRSVMKLNKQNSSLL